MKSQNRYRKFQHQQKNIEALERESSRFKRVFSEYENISNDLWDLQNSEGNPIPDDFIDSINLQASYLEEEIEDWLMKFNENKNQIKS